jgi:putative ABC transport system substrate-binding protein
MMPLRLPVLFVLLVLISACSSAPEQEKDVPVIGFIDFVEDATLAKAREGFFDALKAGGFSEDSGTIEVIYKNAQGDQPTLLQAVDFVIGRQPTLIATNTTLAMVNTIQRNNQVPVFMMVAPRPDLAGLNAKTCKALPYLYGVYETQDYIDTSASLIRELFPNAKRVGAIYSQSEVQSVDALNVLRKGCEKAGLELVVLPVSNSSETQLITQALLAKGIDVFFALPDNVVFASFETIARTCSEKNIPVMTSEAGLVMRGAVASFGADMYSWGYQSGQQAVRFLKDEKASIAPEIVQVRKKVISEQAISRFSLSVDSFRKEHARWTWTSSYQPLRKAWHSVDSDSACIFRCASSRYPISLRTGVMHSVESLRQ